MVVGHMELITIASTFPTITVITTGKTPGMVATTMAVLSFGRGGIMFNIIASAISSIMVQTMPVVPIIPIATTTAHGGIGKVGPQAAGVVVADDQSVAHLLRAKRSFVCLTKA